MKLSERMSSDLSIFDGSHHQPLVELYRNVLIEIKETKSSRNFAKLWSRMAPTGNIYRYMGLSQERMWHCHDLGSQLEDLAEVHAKLLGGTSQPLEARKKRLVDALAKAEVKELGEEGNWESSNGFAPLEEFFGSAASRVYCFVLPRDADGRKAWRMNHLMALLVFLIQIIGPALIFVNQWRQDYNQLRDPEKLLKQFTYKEAFCTGKELSAVLTTLIGTLFLYTIYTIVHNYAVDEFDNSSKLGRLPVCGFWSLVGTMANASCCIFICIAIPIEFWGEDGPTGIIMNAMAMMFIFTFDDLTGDAFGYLGKDDEGFQQEIAWYYSLLSHCPVTLSDLIDDDATSVEALWKITYDGKGILQSAKSAGPCLTRIAPAPPDSKTALVQKEDFTTRLEHMTALYRTSPQSRPCNLPGLTSSFLTVTWGMTCYFLSFVWYVVPIVWFIVNKPCGGV
mmetsp:Transcript_130800/g.279809  ORF Transcript_130800/g.279809 Transcript_130800/m.279809 type:complete len:451 (+) Transcript_130800:74-1426(+)